MPYQGNLAHSYIKMGSENVIYAKLNDATNGHLTKLLVIGI